jgi:hypothetical protein
MNDLATVGADGGLAIRREEIGVGSLPPSMAILLNKDLYERVKAISTLMARAQGMTPAHLIDKGEACFSVVTMALDWKLSWHFVARHTYQTPGGSIGFDGALVQSILEASGRFIASPTFEYRGDWSKLAGKFRMQEGQRGGKYPVATWTDEDAIGLGIIVRWQVRGEAAPRVWPGENEPFWLVQCQPRNSPLWSTDPKTQIAYLAIRRFANMAAPGILGSASFDREEVIAASDLARDITPEPRREDYFPPPQQTSDVVHEVEEEGAEDAEFVVTALDGEVFEFQTADHALVALKTLLSGTRRDPKQFDAAIENNQAVLDALGEAGAALVEEYRPSPAPSAPPRTEPPAPARSPNPPPGRASKPAQEPSAEEMLKDPAEGRRIVPPQERPFPGDLPSGQSLPPREVPPPTRSPAASATGQAGGAGSPAPMVEGGPSSPAGHGPNAPTNASRSEGAGGAKILEMVITRGKPDYRAWVRGKLIPKIRQQTSSDELAYLLGDNESSYEAARRNLAPQDLSELDAELEQAWARLR